MWFYVISRNKIRLRKSFQIYMCDKKGIYRRRYKSVVFAGVIFLFAACRVHMLTFRCLFISDSFKRNLWGNEEEREFS